MYVGLVQLKSTKKGHKTMKLVRQITEKLCVVITIILIYENALVFYLYLFPYWWSHELYLRFFFNVIVGHWLLINSIVHYYYAIQTSPGFVADLENKPSSQEELSYTKCSKCDILRPPRAHHCKVCQKCVVRFDHHCKCNRVTNEKSKNKSLLILIFFFLKESLEI